METPGHMWRWVLYSSLGAAADALNLILSACGLNKRPPADYLLSDVDGSTDEEILDLHATGRALQPKVAVLQLTPSTLSKSSQDLDDNITDASEANALNLVFSQTTIPVPRVRRVVKREWDFSIIMDFIKGPTLAEVWSTLSLWRKLQVVFTLRRYVHQLCHLKASPATPPGPLSNDRPQKFESPILGRVRSSRGPFASYRELTTFFNKRCKLGLDAAKVPEDHPSRKEPFDDSGPLVFTHQDINPRNTIVGEDGRLWIIDWGWVGYFPLWFEYVAMRRQPENEIMIGPNHVYWENFIPFIFGPYFKQEKWL